MVTSSYPPAGSSSSSQLFNEELNHWIATLTPEQRERAVDALFTVLHANGVTSFSEVMSNFPASIPAMLGAYVGLTPADRRHLVEALAILFKASTAKRSDALGFRTKFCDLQKQSGPDPSRNCSRSR